MEPKDSYILARCCSPQDGDSLTGYYSHDNIIKVHKSDCPNLSGADPESLITLVWTDIMQSGDSRPDKDYSLLDEIDFRILAHHQKMGIDYSLAVAAILNLDGKTVFDRHRRLRQMALLERVQPVMVQYRKNIVNNKWIKHRNHTYYDLTSKGRNYLKYHANNT